jgi:thiamine transporter ThiT
MVGVAFYSVVKNGLSFVTFAIIAFVVFIIFKKPNDKAVQEEIKSRNLNNNQSNP